LTEVATLVDPTLDTGARGVPKDSGGRKY